MSVSNWNIVLTIAAGANLTTHQYKAVNPSGVLATSQTNGFGILLNKPNTGEHASVLVVGVAKAFVGGGNISVGDYVQYDNTTSGFLSVATSGDHACGRAVGAANSGYPASVYMFGAPVYLAL